MVNVSLFVKNPVIQKWLTQFLRLMDRGRRQRGLSLYPHAIVTFAETSQGFEAQISAASGYTPYNVSGQRVEIAQDGHLDLDRLHVTCTCPDEMDVCKHIACAMLNWAVLIDKRSAVDQTDHTNRQAPPFNPHHFAWREENTSAPPDSEQPFAELEKQLQLLTAHTRTSKKSLPNLKGESFWPFKEEWPHVMGALHDVVKKGMKN